MQKQESSVIFNQERASSYDKQRDKLAPMRDALHFLIRMVLSELSVKARVLCVGIGTGSELLYLAKTFPRWRFTAVDPAAPMLDICRRRAEECGVASRCNFHEGYLDSLPESDPFDAATCLLVSQFIMRKEKRRRFFCEIAARLSPQGYLVSSDVASDISASTYKSLFDVWLRTLKYSEIPAEEVEKVRTSFDQDVAVLHPREVESLIASSGFDTPVLFFQTLLVHAWYSKIASPIGK